jgi:hypothetical protein
VPYCCPVLSTFCLARSFHSRLRICHLFSGVVFQVCVLISFSQGRTSPKQIHLWWGLGQGWEDFWAIQEAELTMAVGTQALVHLAVHLVPVGPVLPLAGVQEHQNLQHPTHYYHLRHHHVLIQIPNVLNWHLELECLGLLVLAQQQRLLLLTDWRVAAVQLARASALALQAKARPQRSLPADANATEVAFPGNSYCNLNPYTSHNLFSSVPVELVRPRLHPLRFRTLRLLLRSQLLAIHPARQAFAALSAPQTARQNLNRLALRL